MKLLLLKILLQRRARDEGFTLPMVIALGLVMLLLGTVQIVKSNEENIGAINTNSSSDALAIAEIGVARYRELLNQNRILTVYNHGEWHDNVNIIGETCHDMTAAPKASDGSNIWAGTATKPNDDADSATDKSTADDDNWWDIKEDLNGDGDTDDDGETIGKYRLVSYEYDRDGDIGADDTTPNDENGVFSVLSDANKDDDTGTLASGVVAGSITDENDTDDDGESDARGILTVQGQSPDGSEAQVRVEIPLRINDLNNLKPALWIGKGSLTETEMGGKGKFKLTNNDNIVLSNSGGGCPATEKIDGNNVLNDGRAIPPIIDNPSGVPPVTTTTPEIPAIPAIDSNKKNDDFTINRSDVGTGVKDNLLLPQPNATPDKKGDDGRFLYVVKNDLVLNNYNLETDGAAKVTIYVDDKPINITSSSGNTLKIGPQTRKSTASSHYLEIYVAGNKTITIDPNDGKVDIQAFIHAPNSTLEISGSGEVEIKGAVWVKEINNSGGADIKIAADKTTTTTKSEPSYKFYTTTSKRSPRPLTGNPTNWVREEVQ